MSEQAPQRTRLTKSKATASTTAIQTLEITTTAVVTGTDKSPPLAPQEEEPTTDLQKKTSLHHHHHHIRSPAFEARSNSSSPLPSPQLTGDISAEICLPPPFSNKSEAVVALQDAVNGNIYTHYQHQNNTLV